MRNFGSRTTLIAKNTLLRFYLNIFGGLKTKKKEF